MHTEHEQNNAALDRDTNWFDQTVGSLHQNIGTHFAGLLLMLLLTVGGTFVNLSDYPRSWLDEGFSLNAAVTLAETGYYGTFSSDGILLFDPAISTGAPVIVPLALSISLLGHGLAQARMVIMLFTISTLACLYVLTNRLYGIQVTLFAIIFVLAFPVIDDTGLLFKGRQILGEVPAFMFMLIAIIFWKRDWSSPSVIFALLSGLALGLGLITKLQVLLPALPAFVYIALLRAQRRQDHILRLLLPVAVSILVYAAWMVITQALTPAEVQLQNRLVMIDGIRTNFFTDLMGTSLSRSMYVILLIILFGLVAWFWRAYTAGPAASDEESDARWAEAALVAYMVFSVLWIYIFSIGWPRYIFGGFMIALLLAGRALHDLLIGMISRFYPRRDMIPKAPSIAYIFVLVGLLALGFVEHVLPSLFHRAPEYDAAIITYIDTQIDRAAVIESWEWDIIGRGNHRMYHTPHQLVLQETMRLMSQGTDNLPDYDILQADPDYLLIGPFAAWVGIYHQAELKTSFETEIQFGPYHLLRRVRPDEFVGLPETEQAP